MPDGSRDNEAEKEAEMAAAFYEHLIHRNIDERAARELTCAYILGRQRQHNKREPWELDDGSG